MKKLLGVLLVLCLLALVVSGCAQPSKPAEETDSGKTSTAKEIPDEIRIGMVATISGEQALDGKNMTDAITLVDEELKANGGLDVDGKKVQVKFIIEDCEAKPEIAVNAVQKLINQDRALAILGPNNSSDVIASGVISQGAKIPHITNAGTNIKVTQVGDYIFRACFIDPFQGRVVANLAYNELGAKNAAVIYNNADTYSVGLADAFQEEFKALGGNIVANPAYSGADIKDYSAQLTLIKNADPDVVFFPSHISNVPLQLQQARAMGIKAQLLGSESWDYAALPDLVGRDVLEGAYYVTGFSPDAETAKEFVDKYTERFDYRPSFCSAMMYEAAHIVLDAIKRAETIDGPGIRDAMMETDLDLPSGHVVFDENRNPIKSATVLKVIDGVAQYVASISLQ